MHGGPHAAQGNAITLAAHSQLHFPALQCMYSLSAAHAGTAARLRRISYSVCEVTAELTATHNRSRKTSIRHQPRSRVFFPHLRVH